jgi:hypothetical protein
MTGLLRLSRVFEGLLSTFVHGEDSLLLMAQRRLPPLGVDVVGHGLLPDR